MTDSRSIVADYLQLHPPSPRTAVAFVYFDYKNRDIHDVAVVFSNVLRQLLEQAGSIPQGIRQHCEAPLAEEKENDLTINQCLSFLRALRKNFDRIFVIFDALDECPSHDNNGNELRSKMLAAMQEVSGFMSVFMTSRPSVSLTSEITWYTRLEIEASPSDICAYLETRIDNHRILGRMIAQNSILKNEIITTVCSKANGMYV